MALLATKRFLSKSEIFSKVAGYSGSSETMERLFERDKDDLRTLGIPIQVGSHDPLFSDEPGYRIPESEYALTLGELTPTELSYLSLAAKLWRNQLFSESGALALLKIDALGGPIFTEEFGQSLLMGSDKQSPNYLFRLSQQKRSHTQRGPLRTNSLAWLLVFGGRRSREARDKSLSHITHLLHGELH
jgi:predicted DNA-binding transcriptional regulator YafY